MAKTSFSSRNMHTPICSKQIACDGGNLSGPGSKKRGYCVKCKEAMERKTKKPPPLRGENTALNIEQRRIDSLKKGGE
jgi:hypothetical protein